MIQITVTCLSLFYTEDFRFQTFPVNDLYLSSILISEYYEYTYMADTMHKNACQEKRKCISLWFKNAMNFNFAHVFFFPPTKKSSGKQCNLKKISTLLVCQLFSFIYFHVTGFSFSCLLFSMIFFILYNNSNIKLKKQICLSLVFM